MKMNPLGPPRVAAVHDLSGFGKCALSVVIPILSACGVEVCPAPTAVLSANTKFPGFSMTDLTSALPAYLSHWSAIPVQLDGLYSGFISSEEQIRILIAIHERFLPPVTVVDPVMGDNGKLYQTFTQELCKKMRRLLSIADVAVPNLTGACALTATEYAFADTTSSGIEKLARSLQSMGAKNVIITGVRRKDRLFNCLLEGNAYQERETRLLSNDLFGTGDLFASVLTGGLLTGHGLAQSVDSAAAFTACVMDYTFTLSDYESRGVCFEPFLARLAGGAYRENSGNESARV